jgi:hypothetical protein
MPDAKVKVDMWLWPMIGFHPIILVFWARNGRGYGPRLTGALGFLLKGHRPCRYL